MRRVGGGFRYIPLEAPTVVRSAPQNVFRGVWHLRASGYFCVMWDLNNSTLVRGHDSEDNWYFRSRYVILLALTATSWPFNQRAYSLPLRLSSLLCIFISILLRYRGGDLVLEIQPIANPHLAQLGIRPVLWLCRHSVRGAGEGLGFISVLPPTCAHRIRHSDHPMLPTEGNATGSSICMSWQMYRAGIMVIFSVK